MMKYEHLDNHRGEVLRPGTLIQIIDSNDYWSRKGSIFRIIRHLSHDKYAFEIVESVSRDEDEINWDFV